MNYPKQSPLFPKSLNTGLSDNLNTTSVTQKNYEKESRFDGKTIKQSGTPNVHIPKNLIETFDYLHKRFRGKEWSGIIFYKTDGSLPSMSISIDDFLLLDIGTSGFTSFDFNSPLFTEYLFINDHLNNHRMGWLHTHHNMSTFFSGTDVQAFNQLSGQLDMALSVITNEKKDHIARIGFKGKIETSITNHFKNAINTEPEEGLIYWECDVVEEIFVNPALDEMINKILKKKEEERKKEQEKRKLETNRTFSNFSSFPHPSTTSYLNNYTQSSLWDVPSINNEELDDEAFTVNDVLKESVYDLNLQVMGKLLNKYPNILDETNLLYNLIEKSGKSLENQKSVLLDFKKAFDLLCSDLEDIVEIIGWSYVSDQIDYREFVERFMEEYSENSKEILKIVTDANKPTVIQKARSGATLQDIAKIIENFLTNELNKYVGYSK